MATQGESAGSRREAILQAAIRLFGERGYVSTTMDEIALAAGVTKRTLYRHMGSKQAVLVELQEWLMDDAGWQPGATERIVDPTERVRELIEGYARLVLQRSADVTVLFEEMKHLDEVERQRLIARRDQYELELRRALSEARRRGVFGDIDVPLTTYLIIGALNGMRRWGRASSPRPADDLVPFVADVLTGGLVAGSNTALPGPGSGPRDHAEPSEGSVETRGDWETNETLVVTLDHAAELFKVTGYSAVSTREIADSLGTTKSRLYYYMRSKEELLFQVVRRVPRAGVVALEALGARDIRGVEHLDLAIRTHCALVSQYLASTAVMNEEFKYLTPTHRAAVNRLGVQYLILMEGAVRQAADELGVERVDTRTAASILIGMLNDLHRWYSPAGRLSLEAISAAAVRLFLFGLRPEDRWAPVDGMPLQS